MSQKTHPAVAKTIKLFIGGAFPRTESGRHFIIAESGSEKIYANACQASRKDFRNAVQAALKTQPSWQKKTAYLRGQILYRMAEMTEARTSEFVEGLVATQGMSEKDALKEVQAMTDTFVYYAGFSDKYQALMGSINPVAGPHHCFTAAEPVGLVSLVADENESLSRFVAQLSAIIVSGNATVALLPKKLSAFIAPLGEVFATSDLPGGVINLLTGFVDELLPHMASHMEVSSLSFQSDDAKALTQVKEAGVENMKRIVGKTAGDPSLEHLLSFVEYKTVWHPAGY